MRGKGYEKEMNLKRLYEVDKNMRKKWKTSMEVEAHNSRCRYKEWGNTGHFRTQ